MVEDIITGLSRIKWLFVIARNSSFAYKAKVIDVRQVARRTGRPLFGAGKHPQGRPSGSYQRSDGGGSEWISAVERTLRSAAQRRLRAAGRDRPQRSQRDRKVSWRAEVERVRRKRPESLDAYDLVLQSQADVDFGMPAQVNKALVLLGRALALDPTYALAHANVAMCHHCLFLRSGLHEEDRLNSVATPRRR